MFGVDSFFLNAFLFVFRHSDSNSTLFFPRNSTLELLNKLNAKYDLGFGEIKNKILIFPGGIEFMRVIHELTRLSMQIILKKNGIHDAEQQP